MKTESGANSGAAPANPIPPKKRGRKGGCTALTAQEEVAVREECQNSDSGIPAVVRLILLMLLDTGRRQGDLRHLTHGMIRKLGHVCRSFIIPGALTKPEVCS